MQITVLIEINELKTEVVLNKNENSVEQYWNGYPLGYENIDDYKVSIQQQENDNEFVVYCGTSIKEHADIIRDQFIENLMELKKNEIEIEMSGIENTVEETAKVKEINPYDPELIRVDPRPFTIKHIYEMMTPEDPNDIELDLSPDFQRQFVWNDITRKSRLIESLLLRIPLPVFYFTQDREGKFQVVDGVQRLTVIKSFLSNEFRLKNLEYLKECEGQYFNRKDLDRKYSLDPKYSRRIYGTQLSCNIIDPQTPPKVKFDIFKRINTGGKTLNPQEIRNCLASVHVRNFLKRMSVSQEFITATGGSISSTRMADQDLVIRFIGFYYAKILKNDALAYRGDMESFLDDVLSVMNTENLQVLQKIEKAFYNSMKIAHYLFGKYAFRKCLPDHLRPGAKKQLLNKSLFITLSILLSEYEYEKVVPINDRNSLVSIFANEIEADARYYDVLTNGTSDPRRLAISFEIAKRILSDELRYNDDKKY